MDFKEKYQEALERAKQGLPIDEVFPELKESEDERLRKLLVWQVYRNIEDETNDLAGSVYDGVKGHDPDLEESIEDWKKCLAYLEKQKEPKPAEWSEGGEGMLNCIIATLCEESHGGREANGKMVTWLENRLKSLCPQQKQEVVDRNVFYRIADILRWCYLPIGCPVENFKESESEREHLLEIVQCVAHRYANSCTYCKEYSRGYQDGLAVPHWKPSEEQINYLAKAIQTLGEEGDCKTANILNELLNDIKHYNYETQKQRT